MATHSCVPTAINPNKSYYSISSQSSGYTNESSTTYCQINWTRGSNAETYVYWYFDCSPIPDNATILSVTCKCKAYASTTTSSRVTQRLMQLYCNIGSGRGTAKGSSYSYGSSTSTVATLNGGSFTRDELRDVYLMVNAKRGTSNTTSSYYTRFYGATLTVEYEVEKVKYVFTSSAGAGGSITPLGEVEVEEGGSQEYTVSPNSGYALDKVTVDGSAVSVSNNKVTVSADGNHSIVASFLKLGTGLFVKRNGAWTEVQVLYEKRNGAWVETTPAEVFAGLKNGDKTKYTN